MIQGHDMLKPATLCFIDSCTLHCFRFEKIRDKASFHLIADDRRPSRIANDRKESCFHTIVDDRNDRRADCSHTFRSAELSNVPARCARGKIKANNMADIEEEISLQANLFLFLVLRRQQRQHQNNRDKLN